MTSLKTIIIICAYLFNCCALLLAWKSQYTDFRCKLLDRNYITLKKCKLEPNGINGSNVISIHIQQLQPPITNVNVKVELLKKSNGYKPYVRNITINGCQFMKQRKRNPLAGYLFNLVEAYTNVNHTCPIKHDLIVNRLPVADVKRIFYAPIPSGDYAFFSTWSTNNVQRIVFEVYFRFDE